MIPCWLVYTDFCICLLHQFSNFALYVPDTFHFFRWGSCWAGWEVWTTEIWGGCFFYILFCRWWSNFCDDSFLTSICLNSSVDNLNLIGQQHCILFFPDTSKLLNVVLIVAGSASRQCRMGKNSAPYLFSLVLCAQLKWCKKLPSDLCWLYQWLHFMYLIICIIHILLPICIWQCYLILGVFF